MSEHFISRADAERDLLACAAYIAESIIGGEAKASAIASVVPAYLNSGNVDLAAELANSVDDPFTRDRSLIAIAAKCAELNDDEYAVQLAEAIEEPGFQAQALERIGVINAESGELEKAREMSSLLAHPDQVLAAIAVREEAQGDLAGALKTIDEIEYAGAAVFSLNAIAARKIREKDDGSVGLIFDRAIRKASDIEHDEERIASLIGISNLLTAAGENIRAVETLAEARAEAEELDNVHRDSLLGQVSLGYLNAGDVDQADQTLDAVTDKTQIATVLFGFARFYWRRDEKDEAFDALEEAYEILRSQRDTETRDSKAKFSLFNQIASQFAGFEKGERGLEIADRIEDEGQRTAALIQIAGITASQGNDGLSRLAINSLSDVGDRVNALIGMSDVKRETDAVAADDLLNEALRLVDEIPQHGVRASILISLSSRLVGPEKQSLAHSTVLSALRSITQLRSDDLRSSMLVELWRSVESLGLELNDEETASIKSLVASD